MNTVRLILCCILAACTSTVIAQEKGAGVYVFLGPECPICQQCTPELNRLYELCNSNGIALCGVVPGTFYTSAEISEFKATWHIAFPVVRDTAYRLTHLLKATITPQAVVTNVRGDIVYSGAIDNAYVALGRKNKYTTVQYLRDALDALIAGTAVTIRRTTPVGCRIEGLNKADHGL